MISAEEVRDWRPRREVYLYAAKTVGVDPQHLALVAPMPGTSIALVGPG